MIADFIRACGVVRAELMMNLTTVYEICKIVSQRMPGKVGDVFAACVQAEGTGCFSEIWMQTVADIPISADVKRELLRLGDILGRYDVESQIAGIDGILAALDTYHDNARVQYENNGKLYRKVGFSIGIIGAILLYT